MQVHVRVSEFVLIQLETDLLHFYNTAHFLTDGENDIMTVKTANNTYAEEERGSVKHRERGACQR